MKKLILLLMVSLTVICQEKDPNAILNQVKDKFEAVEDYTVDADIKVDVSFLQVPESHAAIYFKKPDKIKLTSEGFALLPKDGLNFSPSSLLAGEYTAIYVKKDTLKRKDVDVIKVIPDSDTIGLVLSTLWIDTNNKVVNKVEAATKKQGTITLEFTYGNEIKYALPSSVKFFFNIGDMHLPGGIIGGMNDETSRKESKKQPMTGSVIVNYKNYKINQGLDDSLFEEKKNN